MTDRDTLLSCASINWIRSDSVVNSAPFASIAKQSESLSCNSKKSDKLRKKAML